MEQEKRITRALALLLVISAVARGFLAGFVELGNDEVYYRLYACYPDLSHFDHPPMVGWAIQLFTLNLLADHEFFLRLASVVLGTVNTWLVFRIGSLVRDRLTGLYAALLYTASFYAFVITGVFILPDTPQNFFWLLTLLFLLKALPAGEPSRTHRHYMLLAGVSAGLAMLSKYSSAALLSGAFFYILWYNRRWFRMKETWLALLLVIIAFTPVILWNTRNDFISFTFHEARITPAKARLFRPDYFGTEAAGQFFYNNPVNVVLIFASLVAWIRGRRYLNREYFRLILWTCAPLILVFLGFSLFRQTLPHWSGPAYTGLILVAAAWLASLQEGKPSKKLVPGSLRCALALIGVTLVLAVTQIRTGWIPLQRLTGDDITLDMYGWRQLGEKFKPLAEADRLSGKMSKDAPILSFRWFPAANLEYYAARPAHTQVYALGTLERIHKYYWINQIRGNLMPGSDAWFLAFSDDYHDPSALYGELYQTILPPDTIRITREGSLAREVYVYRLKGLKKEMRFR